MNIPPPLISTPSGKESTSQAIARFFDREDANDPDPIQVNKAVPDNPPIEHPPMRYPTPASLQTATQDSPPRSPTPNPQPEESPTSPETETSVPPSATNPTVPGDQPKPLPAPATRQMPTVTSRERQDSSKRSLITPTRSPDRKWLFGAAFTGFTILGIGLAVAALTAPVNMADRSASTDDTTTGSQPDDILPEEDSPFGVATIERNESTTAPLDPIGEASGSIDPIPSHDKGSSRHHS